MDHQTVVLGIIKDTTTFQNNAFIITCCLTVRSTNKILFSDNCIYDQFTSFVVVQNFDHICASTENDANIHITRSQAVTEKPRDALYQLISCQLLHEFTKNHIVRKITFEKARSRRMITHFGTHRLATDGQTDGQTEGHTTTTHTALHSVAR